jgi:hypothetical protein
MPWAAAGAVAAAGIGAISSSSAAGKSSDAANNAAALDLQRYNQTRTDLQPYNTVGQAALTPLLATATNPAPGPNYLDLAYANLPGTMTQAQLEATPGYQFNLAQGLKATQNAAAAKGLGVSGAALKGAATYATGLADSTYQNQFANAQQRYTDIFNLNTGQQSNLQNSYARLQGVASLGESAAAQTGTTGAALAGQQGNALMASGNAQAAGVMGAGNALTGGINSYLGYNALQNMTSNGQTGGYTPTGTGTAADTTPIWG